MKNLIFLFLISFLVFPTGANAYSVQSVDAPPVEREKTKSKTKNNRSKRYKLKTIKRTNKMKDSTLSFLVSMVFSLTALSILIIGIAIGGLTVLMWVLVSIFLIGAIALIILGFSAKKKEEGNNDPMEVKEEEKDSGALD